MVFAISSLHTSAHICILYSLYSNIYDILSLKSVHTQVHKQLTARAVSGHVRRIML